VSPTSSESVPVLIVGGGGAGLTASMLLARQGVEHLLVSARPQTSDLPKAHVLNQRAMEILDDVGVADAITTAGTPPAFSQWATDPDVLIRWIYSPQGGVLAVMVPMGPERWGRNGSSTSTTPPTWRSPTRRSRPTRAAPSESATCR
jgi:FAD binding domain